jgi:hypothetical protein
MSDDPTIENGGDGLDEPDRELMDLLGHQRPVPKATFRGDLGRRLAALDPGHGPRPPGLRTIVAAYLATGSFILLAGTLQATGLL